jgi:HSP20 family molecular chaperone IbpA
VWNEWVTVAKKNAGQHWDMLFRGDSSGVRCLKQPYRLVEQTDEVIMEIKVPFWMDKDDIKVTCADESVSECVKTKPQRADGGLRVSRSPSSG